jgi:L-amino acid N-acyltransferase YncA
MRFSRTSAIWNGLPLHPSTGASGLRRRLIEAVVKKLRALGRAHVVADVSSANEASRALMRQAGFEEGISVTFFTRPLR